VLIAGGLDVRMLGVSLTMKRVAGLVCVLGSFRCNPSLKADPGLKSPGRIIFITLKASKGSIQGVDLE